MLDLSGGIGADAALECVGTGQSIATAAAIARPGSTIGIVGVPHGQVPFTQTFFRNVGWRGGPAPARIYMPELLVDVLGGTINPAWSSATRPAWTRSPRLTEPWTSGGPSSHWSGSEQSDAGHERHGHLATRRTRANRRGRRDRAASRRPDRSLRPYVTMWVVRAGVGLYVRSAYGPDNPW